MQSSSASLVGVARAVAGEWKPWQRLLCSYNCADQSRSPALPAPQTRLPGYQGFGGWRGQDAWCGWLYGAFTELCDKARIDLWRHRESVQQMAAPFLVVQNLSHSDSKWPETCMVLITVLDDSKFSETESGALCYDGDPVWSREISKKYWSGARRSYFDVRTDSTADEISRGQFWNGSGIFALLDARNLESSEWRCCDWITLQLLQRQVQTLCSPRGMSAEENDDWRWIVVSFASASAEYVTRLQSYMTLLRETACKFIAAKPWPLLKDGWVVEDRVWRLRFNPPQFARRLLRLPCTSRRLHRLRVLRKRKTRDRDRHRPRRTRAAAAGGAECSSEAWIQRAGMCRGGAPLRKETVVEESLAGCSS